MAASYSPPRGPPTCYQGRTVAQEAGAVPSVGRTYKLLEKNKNEASRLETLFCTAPRHLKGKSSCWHFTHQWLGHSRMSLSTICETWGLKRKTLVSPGEQLGLLVENEELLLPQSRKAWRKKRNAKERNMTAPGRGGGGSSQTKGRAQQRQGHLESPECAWP